ncbi:hypothetical protein EI94DRAFT_1703654 [Lactarius quietus]|nr:hypothetical protein EI94DRAFT_1703654 [Lactarius quietus]
MLVKVENEKKCAKFKMLHILMYYYQHIRQELYLDINVWKFLPIYSQILHPNPKDETSVGQGRVLNSQSTVALPMGQLTGRRLAMDSEPKPATCEKKKSQENFSPYRQPGNLVQVRVLQHCPVPPKKKKINTVVAMKSITIDQKQVNDNDHPSGGEVTSAILLEMACDDEEDVAHRKPGPPKERKAQDVDDDVKVRTPLLSHPRAIIVDDSADCHQPIASLQPTCAGLSTSNVASTVASVPLDR